MLTEERHKIILNLLKNKGLIQINELIQLTNSSESTIRRDLSYLESINALKRIHGGAKLLDTKSTELSYSEKSSKNIQEKKCIGEMAASFIDNKECIFLDAGTSTYELIPFLRKENLFVVTNGLNHINALIERNINCYMIGGKVKLTTKAVVGADALKCLSKFRFDKCFLGTNGIDIKMGLTTPDIDEAIIKECAINSSKKSYILCDESKFEEISFVKFASINQCTIITNRKTDIDKYRKITDVKVVDMQ